MATSLTPMPASFKRACAELYGDDRTPTPPPVLPVVIATPAPVPSPLTAHPHYFAMVGEVAVCAQRAMPAAGQRLVHAVEIVLAGAVQPSPLVKGGWRVQSQSSAGGYDVWENTCTCPDFRYSAFNDPALVCKHIIAVWLYRRVAQRLAALPSEPAGACWMPVDDNGTPCHVAQDDCIHEGQAPAPPTQRLTQDLRLAPALDTDLLTPYIVHIHGKPFVQYAGLLALAHSRGLVRLEARLVSVTDTLALAEATATFADGRVFSEAADATPSNTNAKVALHFPRCALTRAKGRALRDALNVSMVTLEELD